MKRLISTLGMFIASFAFLAITAHAETVAINKTIEVPGATKEQVLNKVREWSSRYAQGYNVDSKAGIIVANGEITYPDPPVDRIQFTIVYNMKNTIEGNKDTVTFEGVMLKSPAEYVPASTSMGPATIGGELKPLKAKRDIVAANNVLTYTADNLKDYLLGKTGTVGPLMRCPECGVTSPTGPTMKEHMKGHEHMKRAY